MTSFEKDHREFDLTLCKACRKAMDMLDFNSSRNKRDSKKESKPILRKLQEIKLNGLKQKQERKNWEVERRKKRKIA